MFMHFGLMHILNNMVVLGAVGQIVEKAMGHVKLLITFLVSGMCGSVLSYIVMLYNNDFAVSAGASGAIFGLVGALVWIVIVNRGFYEGISRQQESSPNLCVNSSFSYISPSMLPLSSGDLTEWSLVCHSILSYQKFCD